MGDAYNQGYRAFLQGLTPNACFYMYGSKEWKEWMMGYQDAEMNDRRV